MTFPFDSLMTQHKELGLIVAVLLGFGFGFVLERAGFGRSSKLAAQFYLHDMTVFKVMFSAIVTAMLVLVLASGLGLADLSALSQQIVSWTYLWPMLIGGFVLGMGFIISGYCPGTSIVAAASGHIDGWVTLAGVTLGSLAYSEIQPTIAAFHNSGDLGALFLYDALGIPPQVLAVGVVLMAVGCFIGAEKVEAIFSRKRATKQGVEEAPRRGSYPVARRLAFATFGFVAVLVVATLVAPVPTTDASIRQAELIGPVALAHRVLEEPWNVRVIDVRSQEACAKERIPGAECVPVETLGNLGLEYAPGHRDLVIVTENSGQEIPSASLAYQGRVFALENGFDAWRQYALTIPEPPGPAASEEDRQAYLFQAALYQSLTGEGNAAPPPPAPTTVYVPKKKKGGGGCS
jgi:rhodanese-related sulfurtransferase